MATISGIQKMSWREFTAIPTGTQVLNYSFDQCVALFNLFSQGVVGAAFAPCQSAYQLWTNFDAYGLGAYYTRSSVPVAGSVFIARYGIYNAPHGHVGVVVSVGAGVINTMEQNSEVNRFVGRATRSASANILGYLVPKRPVTDTPLTATQRQAGANPVRRRAGASTSSALKQPALKPHEVGNFVGWVKGEQVNDGIASSNVWYKGISGDFFWAGGFTSQSTKGLKDLTPVAPNGRRTGPVEVIRREAATTKSTALTPPLKANTVYNFRGWVKGERVTVGSVISDIWYAGEKGFFSAAAFTTQSTTGLKDLNPKPAVNERVTGANPVNIREAAAPSGKLAGSYKPSTKVIVYGYRKGAKVSDANATSDIWYKVNANSERWAWAGGFTSQNVTGLKELKAPQKPVEPPPVLDPNDKPKPPPEGPTEPPTTPPGVNVLVNVNEGDFPAWIQYENVPDREIEGYTAKQWNDDLYDWYKNERDVDHYYSPEEVHLHWWDDPAKNPQHDNVVAYLKNAEGLTVNFVVSSGRVTSMVPLTYCATTTGLRNAWGWKMEIDPNLTEEVYKTVAAIIYIVEKKNPKLRNEPLRLHKEFMATSCSNINTEEVTKWLERFQEGTWDITTGEEVKDEGEEIPKGRRYVQWEASEEGSFRGYIDL